MIGGPDRSGEKTAYQTILQAEMEYLKRSDDRKHNQLHRSFIWILVLISLLAFIWRVINTIPQEPSLLYWLLTKLNVQLTNYYSPGGLNDTVFPFTLLFPLCVVAWELWLMFQTLAMSTNSIARERSRKNWELLLLTGVTTQQILRAKWQAVVCVQWRNYVLLAIMRIGAVSFLAMSFSVDFSFGLPPFFSYGSLGPVVGPQITTVFLIALSIVLLSAVVIALLTILSLMFTAACGIVGGSIMQRASVALACGIGVRILLVGIIAMLVGVPGYLGLKPDIETSNYYPDPVFSTVCLILSLMGTTIIDNGTIAAGLLMRFGYSFRWYSSFNGFSFFSDTLRGHGPAFLTALVLSILMFVVFTCILLWRAEKIISSQSLE